MARLVDVLVCTLLTLFLTIGTLGCCIAFIRALRRDEEERNAAAWAAWTLAAKKKLRHFPYTAAVEGRDTAASGERPECAICLETFVQGVTCSEIPTCRHFFHQECIEPWMGSNSTCPLCRATIVMVTELELLSATEDMV